MDQGLHGCALCKESFKIHLDSPAGLARKSKSDTVIFFTTIVTLRTTSDDYSPPLVMKVVGFGRGKGEEEDGTGIKV